MLSIILCRDGRPTVAMIRLNDAVDGAIPGAAGSAVFVGGDSSTAGEQLLIAGSDPSRGVKTNCEPVPWSAGCAVLIAETDSSTGSEIVYRDEFSGFTDASSMCVCV